MSKLFNLKNWLTIEDAARHLAIVFGEDVSEADVLRLALDRRLKLSVHFVNHTTARRGNQVPIREAITVPGIPIGKDGKPCEPYEVILGLKMYNPKSRQLEEVVQFDKNIIEIEGVWDLTMFGGEELDVEHRYQMLTDGPEVELVNIDGSYVQDQDGVIFELQSSFEDNKYFNGELKKPYYHRDNFYPAGGLPADSVLVVRTDALRKFEQSINDASTPTERAHVSDKLARLNQAAAKFWVNADRNDRGTHPSNGDVAAWLVDQAGYSATLADKAATIIRPEWAPTGRKPEE